MARLRIPSNWGFTFAEHPDREAPDARIILPAKFDPGTIPVRAVAVDATDPDAIDPKRLMSWMTIVPDAHGPEHIVLSDTRHHVRIDNEGESFSAGRTVRLLYGISATAGAEEQILALRRFLHVYQYGEFSPRLFPVDTRIDRGLLVLRVYDALRVGATHREIAEVLFGKDRLPKGRAWKTEALHSQVRRLASEARRMEAGAYRFLLARPHSSRG